MAERVEVCRPKYFPGIELWSMRQRARWTMLQDSHIFGACDDAPHVEPKRTTTLRYRGQELALQGSCLLFGTPGEVIRELAVPSGGAFHLILVSPDAFGDSFQAPGPVPPVLDSERLHQLFCRAWRAVEAHELDVTEREHRLRTFLARACVAAARAANVDGGPSSSAALAVLRARDFIHAHSVEPITLTDVARAAGLSLWYLERSFTAHVGLPIHGYLQQVRLTCAMALLRRGVKAAIAAPQAGFADQSHMTRAFRRCLGVTPRRFQQAERG